MKLFDRIEQAYIAGRIAPLDPTAAEQEERRRRAALLDRYRDLIAQAHAAELVPDAQVIEIVGLMLDIGFSPLHLKDHFHLLDDRYSTSYIKPYPDDFTPTSKPGKGVPPALYQFISDEHEAQRMARIQADEDRLNELRQALSRAVAAPEVTDDKIALLVALMVANGKRPRDIEPAIAQMERHVDITQIWHDPAAERGGLYR